MYCYTASIYFSFYNLPYYKSYDTISVYSKPPPPFKEANYKTSLNEKA